jgi:HK97 family phage major capsid protein
MTRNEIITRLRAIQTEMRSEGADIEALTKEATGLRQQLEQIEARNRLFDGLPEEGAPETNPIENRGGGGQPESPEEARERTIASPEYRSAWLHRLQGRRLNEAEQRAMSTAADSAGAAVPQTTMNLITERLEQRTALYPLISRSNVPGALKIPVEGASTAASWKQQNAAITASEAPVNSVSLAGYELVKLVTVSIAAKLMTIDAFENFVVNQIVRKMAIAIEAAIVSGSGTDEPTGILTGVAFATTGTAPNKVEFTKGSVPTYDNIMDALALLPGDYHANAVFVCSTKTKYKYIRKIKDNDGRPFFDQGMIDGKRVVVNDRVPDKKILICDPSYYHMNAQKDITIDISDQSGFRNAQIDYRGYAVMDGKPLLAEAFVLIDEATA